MFIWKPEAKAKYEELANFAMLKLLLREDS